LLFNLDKGWWALLIMLVVATVPVGFCAANDAYPKRTNNRSPVFFVAEDDVGFFMNYTGYRYHSKNLTDGERFFTQTIGDKALDMIKAAEQTTIMSVFLYDSFYAKDVSDRDLVGMLQETFLQQRALHPEMNIAVILDPSHKAYGRRVSPAEKELRANGVDVFYSDLLAGLKKASLLGTREGLGHVNRMVDRVTFNGWGNLLSGLFSVVKLPVRFDGDLSSLESAYNAFLLKANHRKLLVTDIRGGVLEALITSANPHNASAYHVNTAISVRGAPARYIYEMLREDMKQSASLGRRYAHWHDEADSRYRKQFFLKSFPSVRGDEGEVLIRTEKRPVGVTIVSESGIQEAVIDMLTRVQEGDEVRIQMFYLSFQPVLDAIVAASEKTGKPIRILLDANKESFNKTKDGTPNRQVARYLRQASPNIHIRWYSTHGEQNHAKIMSITNPSGQKYELTTGSCNWTGRNMDGVNMEANVVVSGASKICGRFNKLFDLFWSNDDGNEYSVDGTAIGTVASDRKWKRGERPYYLSTF
jgi:hypothetical protein